jgi:hypothetical protein
MSSGGGEGRGEAFRGLPEGQPVIGGPEIEGVSLGLALGMEAAEHALSQVDREGAMPVAGGVVQGARSAALGAKAPQGIEVAEVPQHLFDRPYDASPPQPKRTPTMR